MSKTTPSPNFDLNAIIRGAQLTIVGALRALQNPDLFKQEHYRQAVIAVGVGIAIRLVVLAPIFIFKLIFGFLGIFVDMSAGYSLISYMEFAEESVLQIPFFLMQLMRYIAPTLDDMFMQSLKWVDDTYMAKHSTEERSTLRELYYPRLASYRPRPPAGGKNPMLVFLQRWGRRAGISLVVYLLSFTPGIGRFVLPSASFYTLSSALGPGPAIGIFTVGLFLPRRWMVMFLQGYFASRGLMRELLEPYFSRIPFTSDQKRRWFREREGLLFGFGIGFYFLTRIPWLGVLIYGIAEASTAYLITKVTAPVPEPKDLTKEELEKLVVWENKHEFLNLEFGKLDKLNIRDLNKNRKPQTAAAAGAQGPPPSYTPAEVRKEL
ncbi:uncharacterized protein H6S33_012896 [Morchella sextelata]|uniref:uncharacterized protein n=1 Tax=Morchella sextelata TaxID=1174677 RepID=UPI001D04EE3E|nr:uncharacterized protein H6S33_012896 [Morchella sextelata]KAH0609410.1 hypothetical protein H6S33_012896 [Morchella sextelata]